MSRMAENEEGNCGGDGSGRGRGNLGETADFSIVLESETYLTVIPIEALREDQKGFLSGGAEPAEDHVLGEELKAVRVDVTVLEKGTLRLRCRAPSVRIYG